MKVQGSVVVTDRWWHNVWWSSIIYMPVQSKKNFKKLYFYGFILNWNRFVFVLQTTYTYICVLFEEDRGSHPAAISNPFKWHCWHTHGHPHTHSQYCFLFFSDMWSCVALWRLAAVSTQFTAGRRFLLHVLHLSHRRSLMNTLACTETTVIFTWLISIIPSTSHLSQYF